MGGASLFANIPEELRALKQFVLWRYENVGAAKLTKVPYQINGKLANVTEANTWSSFKDCVTVFNGGAYSGIGFVFSNDDPYTFIDLDDAEGDDAILQRQLKVYHEFNSYSEISPSGKGLHIIVKGVVPAGRRRSKIEIYSSQRYATMTGNVYNGQNVIKDCQELLTQLWEQMGSGPVAQSMFQGNDKETDSDEEIIKRASCAVNGDKFIKLLSGQWNDNYQSQSEADFAFIDMIAFYTQNRIQISRIFRSTSLGQRDKAKRNDYVNSMITRSFDRMLPPLDFDGLKNQLELKLNDTRRKESNSNINFNDDYTSNSNFNSNSNQQIEYNGAVAQRLEPIPHKNLVAGSNPASPTTIPIPPGLLGEIAHFIYQASPRPVPEISLAAAIGLMAGICGRAYNILGTGLNQYVLVLAKTGRGKEAAALGIDKLMNAVRAQVPTSTRFRGPGIINSGQALTKYINTTSNCFVSVLGEFGITVERISNPYANSADKMLYSNLLDLYNKSGFGQTFQPAIYSKKEDSVGMTESPAVTILGESTHKLFYGSLNEDMIAAGLLPRFLIIEYNGYRVDLNEEHNNVQPSFFLQEKFASLIAQVETIMSGKRVINVQANDQATKMLRDFDRSSTAKINASDNNVVDELWNRAHMKVLRLSALIAVGVNMIEPVIIPEYVQWSINLVQNDIRMLSSKFETGEVGKHANEHKQQKELIRMIKDYYKKDWEYISKYTKEELMFRQRIIPYVYFNKRLSPHPAFNNDPRFKASVALQTALKSLVNTDKIRELSHLDLKPFNTRQACYVLNDLDLLDSD